MLVVIGIELKEVKKFNTHQDLINDLRNQRWETGEMNQIVYQKIVELDARIKLGSIG